MSVFVLQYWVNRTRSLNFLKIRNAKLGLIHHSGPCSESLSINRKKHKYQKVGWSWAVIRIYFGNSRSVVLTPGHTSASPGGRVGELGKLRFPGSSPRVFFSVCLGCGRRTCIFHKFPGDADAAGVGGTPGEAVVCWGDGSVVTWTSGKEGEVKSSFRVSPLCCNQSSLGFICLCTSLHEISY